MKKYLAIIAAMLTIGAFADTPAFELVSDLGGGKSYLQINQDMEAFGFTSTSGWGTLGVFKYGEGGASEVSMAGGINKVDVGDVKAGDKIGFYLKEYGSTYSDWYFINSCGLDWITFPTGGWAGNESMTIGGFYWNEPIPPAQGAPLPGSLAVLLVGGLFAGAKKLRKRNA